VRVWRDPRLQLASEKQGIVSVLLFLWESHCEDCVCKDITLKCNTRRAGLVVTSVMMSWVQFDSDYSVEDDASPFFF
jgi:hypothetical protein